MHTDYESDFADLDSHKLLGDQKESALAARMAADQSIGIGAMVVRRADDDLAYYTPDGRTLKAIRLVRLYAPAALVAPR